MFRTTLFSLTSLAVLSTGAAQANDIIDFLRAIQGPPAIQQQPRGRGSQHFQTSGRNDRLRRSAFNSASRSAALNRRGSLSRSGRSGLSFHVSIGNQPQYQPPIVPVAPLQPVVPAYPVLPEPPRPGELGHLPFEYGQVVTCRVPIEQACVVVKDTCEIAPGAVPTVIAVRNPNLSRFRSRGCVEESVYVQIMAPNCPPQRCRVSPCRTKIRLDYGRYEVDIVSRNGRIEIEYDN